MIEPLQQPRWNDPAPVPIANIPDQTDRKGAAVGILRRVFAARDFEVRAAHLDLLACRPDGVRDLHDFNVDVELHVGSSVVQRQHTIDPFDAGDQRQQLRLTPDDDFARDLPQWQQEAGKLDGIAKPVIAAHKDAATWQRFASPDALEMAWPLVLPLP
jgi:hypothetical protein